MNVHVREYRPQDLGQVLRLWTETAGRPPREDWLTLDQAVDLLFAAHEAAQRAFEREHFEKTPHRARTADFLAVIRETRPTLTPEMVAEFVQDTERFARV